MCDCGVALVTNDELDQVCPSCGMVQSEDRLVGETYVPVTRPPATLPKRWARVISRVSTALTEAEGVADVARQICGDMHVWCTVHRHLRSCPLEGLVLASFKVAFRKGCFSAVPPSDAMLASSIECPKGHVTKGMHLIRKASENNIVCPSLLTDTTQRHRIFSAFAHLWDNGVIEEPVLHKKCLQLALSHHDACVDAVFVAAASVATYCTKKIVDRACSVLRCSRTSAKEHKKRMRLHVREYFRQ